MIQDPAKRKCLLSDVLEGAVDDPQRLHPELGSVHHPPFVFDARQGAVEQELGLHRSEESL